MEQDPRDQHNGLTPRESGNKQADGQPTFSPASPFPSYETPVKKKHSGPGIASFIVSLAMYAVFAFAFAAIFVAIQDLIVTKTGELAEDIQNRVASSPAIVLAGLGFLGAGVGQLVALVLGIIGLVQKERHKVFAILGVIFSGLFVCGTGLLLLLALAVAGSQA